MAAPPRVLAELEAALRAWPDETCPETVPEDAAAAERHVKRALALLRGLPPPEEPRSARERAQREPCGPCGADAEEPCNPHADVPEATAYDALTQTHAGRCP